MIIITIFFILALTFPATSKAPYSNVWAELTHSEVSQVYDWLLEPSRNLNLTDPKNATVTDNYVWQIEKLHTNKTSVLNYIDDGGSIPITYARVVIVQNGQANPVVQEYMVGPLPISSSTTLAPLNYIYHRSGAVPFNAGVWDTPRLKLYETKINEIMCGIQDITRDLTGFVYCDDEHTMIYTPMSPISRDGSRTILWVTFQEVNTNFWKDDTAAATILPVGFILGLDLSGTDSSLHKLLLLAYNGQYFKTIDDFVGAYKNGTLKRAPKISKDTTWTFPKRNDSVPVRPLGDKHSPISEEPDGTRYTVSEDNYVEWMDWSFFISHSKDLGISLYDIQFKGQRIIYELAVQEALTHYSGNNPYTAWTAYLDRYLGIGEFQFQLIEGYDVPYGSTFLDTFYHKAGQTITQKNSIAIYEINSDTPLQHHTKQTQLENGEYDWTWISSIRGSVLVVRTMSTIGNYDFIFDYIFHLDGSIETKVSASGYLQATFNTILENDYGYRVQDLLNAGVHSHLWNWKIDFDICGEHNSFQKVNIVPISIEYPFYEDIEPGPLETFKLEKEWVSNEEDSRLLWPMNMQSAYLILNQNSQNSWGEHRAYRITSGYPGVVSITQNSTILRQNAQWTKNHVAVSVQKDTEPSSSALLNQNLPWDPMVNFDKFFDGEDLNQTDLVVWITVGMHHFANTRDIPNTIFPATHSSFILSPFNYFDREVATDDSMNRVWIENHDGEAEVTYYENLDNVENIQCTEPIKLFEIEEW